MGDEQNKNNLFTGKLGKRKLDETIETGSNGQEAGQLSSSIESNMPAPKRGKKPYLEMATEAIAHDDKRGSSTETIVSFIITTYPDIKFGKVTISKIACY